MIIKPYIFTHSNTNIFHYNEPPHIRQKLYPLYGKRYNILILTSRLYHMYRKWVPNLSKEAFSSNSLSSGCAILINNFALS